MTGVRLSVCCMTVDPPGRVAASLGLLRDVADEIVVAADSRVSAGELGAYEGVADRVVRFDFREPVDRPRGWLARQCRGEWILWIDGDEVPSRALVEALPELVESDDVVQHLVARRWLYPTADEWLAEPPWWPDFQVRLVRNDATLAPPAELHAGIAPVLPARHVEAPMYHLDCVVTDEATRRAKAARYTAATPKPPQAYGGGNLDEVLYVPEEWAHRELRPVPDEDRVWIEKVLAADTLDPAATTTSNTPTPAPPVVAPEEIDAVASLRDLPESAYRAGLALFEPGDVRLAPGERRPLYVRVENRGVARWPWGWDQEPHIRVSYHWRTPAGEVSVYDGVRSALPGWLNPSESALVPVWVEAPAAEGDWVLEIDLVHEHVRWFEMPLAVPVRVEPRCAPGTTTLEARPRADHHDRCP